MGPIFFSLSQKSLLICWCKLKRGRKGKKQGGGWSRKRWVLGWWDAESGSLLSIYTAMFLPSPSFSPFPPILRALASSGRQRRPENLSFLFFFFPVPSACSDKILFYLSISNAHGTQQCSWSDHQLMISLTIFGRAWPTYNLLSHPYLSDPWTWLSKSVCCVACKYSHRHGS